MRSDEVFELLVSIEEKVDTSELRWNSFNLWPLLRQILYVELLSNTQISQKPIASAKISFSKGMVARLSGYTGRILSRIFKIPGNEQTGISDEERVFISRAPYLQQLPSGEYFDRIVDPLVFLSKNQKLTKKFYIGPMPGKEHLSFTAECLTPVFSIGKQQLPSGHIDLVQQIAELASLNDEYLNSKFYLAFNGFISWYRAGIRFLQARKQLQEIFVTSWYFPDVMGICAAARERGIKVIDVQHGKQGRYQVMYSGWTKIPERGYDLMPDYFWCWGQPSCDHILRSSPDRNIHRPFVGGFPWLDYYKSFVSQPSTSANRELSASGIPRVLVTTQPSQASNLEPIPDFLIQFLSSAKPDAVKFVFRCHPNDRGGVSYCKERLASVSKSLYCIDDGKDNLYDKLLASTHHVTAYSSCCYEAEALGVPTLLFGEDAKSIYTEEIESGNFFWTSGSLADFVNWIDRFSATRAGGDHNVHPYVVSSMSHSSRVLASCRYA